MMTAEQQVALISAITYKPGWTFLIGVEKGGRFYVQASVDERSDLTMDPTGKSAARTPWKSGKRYLSPHMCRQEVVGLVFGLIKDAEEHETREWFRYRGASIFNPHLDPDVLVEVARKKASFNVRENAMSMVEAVEAATTPANVPPPGTEWKMEPSPRTGPLWTQGFSSDSVAAQVRTVALEELWDILGVSNQTDAIQRLKAIL